MVYTLALKSTSWLATLTGEASLTIYSNDNLQEIARTTMDVDDPVRFKGFLFRVNGALVLFSDTDRVGFGKSIGPN